MANYITLKDIDIKLFLDLELNLTLYETVQDIAHEENKDERLKKFKEYEKYDRLKSLAENLIEHGLEKWDWNYCAEKGLFCTNDFDMFKEEFKEAGVDLEAYKKKWERKPQ